MSQTIDIRTLKQKVYDGEIDTVVTAFPDMYGRFMGKRITGHFFVDVVAENGMHACDYLLACDVEMDPVSGYNYTSWDAGYGDFHAVADMETLRIIPWLEKTAFVICDLQDEGNHQPIEVAPRTILRRQLDNAKAKGYLAIGASELEFYLFKETYESAKEKHFENLQTYGWYIEDYHILQSTKEEGFIRNVRNAMDRARIPVEFSKGEWGPGQHEINLHYADFMEMADRHCLYKHGIKEIAHLQELAVTFMAKWNAELAGSSCHIHSSLWDASTSTSLFFDENAEGGRSKVFESWLAGQMAHARELSLFYAPFINSYKRYQDASFAPTRIVWSRDNRTAGFREVGHGSSLRAENRIPGADVNPYLAYAATLAAGLDGIEKGLELQDAFEGNAYEDASLPQVPHSLEEAHEVFRDSEFARGAFGDTVVEHYAHTAAVEIGKFRSAVTDWELRRHFERT